MEWPYEKEMKRVARTESRVFLGLCVLLLIVLSIWMVSGQLSQSSNCCEKTLSGAFCINTDSDKCDLGFKTSPTSCESTSYCKLGTCYDSSEGICMKNTPQRVCQESGGTWDERDSNEIPQCQLGCCLIADQAAFVPLVRCKKLASSFGVEMNYRKDVGNEVDCVVY